MITAIYSFLHFMIDGICAAALFSRFASEGNVLLNFLVYNFCAFVLQMPFGAILDVLAGKDSKKAFPFVFAAAGAVLTLTGAFVSPVLLGIGNALFHVGGGVETIREDRRKQTRGRQLGIFVAPGAMGIFLGRLIGTGSISWHPVFGISLILILIPLFLLYRLIFHPTTPDRQEETAPEHGSGWDQPDGEEKPLAAGDGASFYAALLLTGCFLVVILRSLTGLAVGFAWKNTVWMSLLAVTAVVLGKILGGIFAASLGRQKTVIYSLAGAALCYAFSENLAAGLMALLLFNMTMPVTLQMLVDRFRRRPGTMFGFLTVGLFLGYLPVQLHLNLPVTGKWLGVFASVISLLVLVCQRREMT
ncbi:MAG: hypothetical protein J5589_05160 [Firmicutes bacterium]|nr:hypothetical protein [Bacillota bacterium]